MAINLIALVDSMSILFSLSSVRCFVRLEFLALLTIRYLIIIISVLQVSARSRIRWGCIRDVSWNPKGGEGCVIWNLLEILVYNLPPFGRVWLD